VRVTDRYFGPIWYTQAQFHPSVTPIDVHFGKWRRKKHIIVREESAVPIVPTAKFGKTGLDVTKLRLRQLDLYVVIVGIPDPVAVDRKQAVLAERPLKVQVLDAAVRLIAWQPVLLLELCLIAAGDYSANTELDPVFVFRGFFCCCCHRFSIGGFAGAQRTGCANRGTDEQRQVPHDRCGMS
jgi:hypothetical protein